MQFCGGCGRLAHGSLASLKSKLDSALKHCECSFLVVPVCMVV